MEIALAITAVVSLVAGIFLGRRSVSWWPQKFVHPSSRFVYWIEDDLVHISPGPGDMVGISPCFIYEQWFVKQKYNTMATTVFEDGTMDVHWFVSERHNT